MISRYIIFKKVLEIARKEEAKIQTVGQKRPRGRLRKRPVKKIK